MNQGAWIAAAQALDRAAAETRELEWIAPLTLIRDQILFLAEDGAPEGFADAVEKLCAHIARSSGTGEPLPPDAPRKLLFQIFDAACPPQVRPDADALRRQCVRCAALLRSVRAARRSFQRAWRSYPMEVRREEEAAFEAEAAELEGMFSQLLRAWDGAIRAGGVRARLRQARAAQQALLELPEIARAPFSEAAETPPREIFPKKCAEAREYPAETDV